MNKNYIAVLGKFDGVHIAHQKLIRTAVDLAKTNNMRTLVIAIVPDGSSVITDLKQREELIYSLGVDAVEICRLTDDIRCLSPEDFVKDFLADKFNVRHIAVGYNFRFGKNRSGDAEILKSLCDKYSLGLTVIDKVYAEIDGSKHDVNSTFIRAQIESGNMDVVRLCLGRDFCIHGKVVLGKKLGRKLGYPTANILYPKELILPPFGVYATHITIDGIRYCAVTNIGTNPTVDDDGGVRAESHILDFCGDLYGRDISICFAGFIRPETRFQNIQALADTIALDVNRAKEILNKI